VGYARFGGGGLESLERLAEGTAAQAFEASSTLDLASFYDEIHLRMLNSYVLRYPAGMDGQSHSIDVGIDGKQDTRAAVYPDLRDPSWPLALGGSLLVLAGVTALVVQRRKKARTDTFAVDERAEISGTPSAESPSTPALRRDRVIMRCLATRTEKAGAIENERP
jgi:hypothetical protein